MNHPNRTFNDTKQTSNAEGMNKALELTYQ